MGFAENPLSLSVPDEHFKSWAASNSQAAAAEATAATRRAPRHKGRSLATLTVDDMLQRARPWSEFFGGKKPQREFSVPRSWEDASYKLGENVFEFIGNYLLVALACVCCVLYKRPVALIGILVTSKAWEWLQQEGGADEAPPGGDAGASPGGLRSPRSPRAGGPRTPGGADAAPPPPPRPRSRLQRLKKLAVSIFTWAVMMFSHVVPAMIMAGILSLIVVCLHGALRNPVPPLRGRRRR